MAKKTKRTTTGSTVVASIPAARTEFNPDYTNIKRDLARIGFWRQHFLLLSSCFPSS